MDIAGDFRRGLQVWRTVVRLGLGEGEGHPAGQGGAEGAGRMGVTAIGAEAAAVHGAVEVGVILEGSRAGSWWGVIGGGIDEGDAGAAPFPGAEGIVAAFRHGETCYQAAGSVPILRGMGS